METVEETRKRYRPKRILTLFVGESAPNSGKFFYYGNTAMTTNMRKAIEAAGLGGRGDFLDRFKAFGWYLDDLALTPVNDLPPSQREMECLGAQKSLAARIAEYNPRAIVPLLLGIKDIVKAAADDAGNTAPHYPVPFPGQGNQERFQEEMKHILPKLPREPA